MKKQMHITADSLNYVNKSLTTLQDNDMTFQQNINSFKKVIRELELNSTIVQYQTLFNEHELFVESLIQEAIVELDEVINAVLFARRNILHPSLIAPKVLLRELSLAHLPPERVFPFELKLQSVHKFFEIVKIELFATPEQNLVFIIRIPLVSTDKYILYHLHPFPVPSNSSPFFFHYIDPISEYIVINQQKTRQINLPNMDACLALGINYYMCHAPEIRFTTTGQECATAILLTTDRNQPPSSCHVRSLYSDLQIFHKILGNRWLFISSEDTRITLDWMETQRLQDINIKGRGILSLEEGCRAITPIGILTAVAELNQTIIFDPPFLNFEFFDKLAPPKTAIFNITPTKIQRLSVDDFRIVSNKMHEYEKLIQQDHHSAAQDKVTQYIWYIIYTLISLVVLYLLAKFRRCLFDYYQCCCPKSPSPQRRSDTTIPLRPLDPSRIHQSTESIHLANGQEPLDSARDRVQPVEVTRQHATVSATPRPNPRRSFRQN